MLLCPQLNQSALLGGGRRSVASRQHPQGGAGGLSFPRMWGGPVIPSRQSQALEGPWWELSSGAHNHQRAGTPTPEAHVRAISPVAEPTHFSFNNYESKSPFSFFPSFPLLLPTP